MFTESKQNWVKVGLLSFADSLTICNFKTDSHRTVKSQNSLENKLEIDSICPMTVRFIIEYIVCIWFLVLIHNLESDIKMPNFNETKKNLPTEQSGIGCKCTRYLA